MCACFLSPSDDDIQSYLPTLMESMLSALNNSVSLKLKELAVSAIGAIGNHSYQEKVTQMNSFLLSAHSSQTVFTLLVYSLTSIYFILYN